MESCPESGEGEPVQEVTGATAAAEAAVAALSATAAEDTAWASAAQQTITGLENEPGWVSGGGSQEPPPARGVVQSRVFRSGRPERSSRAGLVGIQAALCSPLESALRTARGGPEQSPLDLGHQGGRWGWGKRAGRRAG